MFSRISLQILFCVFAIFVLSILLTCIRNNFIPRDENNFYKHLSWGFRQLADGGSVTQTLGTIYQSRGEYPKALEYYQKSLAIREKVYGKEHKYTQLIMKAIENTEKEINKKK